MMYKRLLILLAESFALVNNFVHIEVFCKVKNYIKFCRLCFNYDAIRMIPYKRIKILLTATSNVVE